MNIKCKMARIPSYPNYFVDFSGRFYREWSFGLKEIRVHKNGEYLQVTLYKNGKPKMLHAAHLVLEAFVGPRPPGLVCCHGPLGRLNCSLDNLSWKTGSENNFEDKLRDGTLKYGEDNPASKLKLETVRKIRELSKTHSQKEISSILGVCSKRISSILTGASWANTQ